MMSNAPSPVGCAAISIGVMLLMHQLSCFSVRTKGRRAARYQEPNGQRDAENTSVT